jgi:hypothetical protein
MRNEILEVLLTKSRFLRSYDGREFRSIHMALSNVYISDGLYHNLIANICRAALVTQI